MNLKDLSLEIQAGDIINNKYRVDKITASYAICIDPEEGQKKFLLRAASDKYGDKINTVARNGKTYYKKLTHGGNRR